MYIFDTYSCLYKSKYNRLKLSTENEYMQTRHWQK